MRSEHSRLFTRVLLAASTLWLLGAAPAPSMLELGKRLYRGEQALTARMVGHDDALPQAAVVCSNCHQRESEPSTTLENTQNFGPKLGPANLKGKVARRGGPRSSYDARSFCRVLREGIDPAYVMIQQTMPRYTFTDAECEALWSYLNTP
jgi:hypothetical protein